MKKYYFIYLFFLCLVAAGCEKTVLEEKNPATQATTRTTLAELGYYGTNFLNVSAGRSQQGIEHMQGEIEVYPDIGTEYTFWFSTSMNEGGVKSVISVSNGRIIYNGRESTYLYGENGKQLKFTVRFHSKVATFSLDLETSMNYPFYDNRVFSKVAIARKEYNGELLPSPVTEEKYGPGDLVVEARYVESVAENSLEWLWRCTNCGFLNSKNDTSCKSCGRK